MTYLAPCVAEDNGLCNCEGVIKVAQRVKLPVLLFNSDEELLDAFKGQFITLDKDANRVGHEFCCHLKYIIWQRGAKKDDLRGRGEVAVDVINLVLEALVKKLIGLVQDEHLYVTGAEYAPSDHVKNAAGRSGDNVLAIFEFTYVFAN